MKSKLVDETNGLCTYVVVFGVDDDVNAGLLEFATEKRLEAGHFTAIGGFRDAVLGYYDWDARKIVRNQITEQVEVVSLIGNFARSPEGNPQFHAHVAVARRDGSMWGGHLLEAHARPTVEVVVTEAPAHLQRTYDQQTGMAVIRLG